MWVYFSGEVRGIKTGWRVTEVEEGNKWVFLRTVGKRRHKVRKKVWDEMGKKKFELTKEESTTSQLRAELDGTKETLDMW